MADTQHQIPERSSTPPPPPELPREEKPKKDFFSNILAIVGLIILVIIIVWGLFNLATLAGPWLSSLFSRPNTVQVIAPTSAVSGSPFTIRWKYSPDEEGVYAFLYPCRSGLAFEAVLGETENTIPCGVAVSTLSDNLLDVTPTLDAEEALEVPLSVIFIPQATSSKQVQGSATVRITPEEEREEPEVVDTTPSTPTVTRPSGPADLSVSITSATADQYGNATVVFNIANIGGSASGPYYFTAQLPTSDTAPYTSPQQTSLGAGDHIVNTLRFSQAISGTFSISVQITDANSANNYASQALSAPYYGGYTQPYNYTTQPYYYNQPYNQQYVQPLNQPYYQYQVNQPQPYLPAQAGYPYQQYPYIVY